MRITPSFIPELSLVAVEDGKIVGHILFYQNHHISAQFVNKVNGKISNCFVSV